MNPKFGYSTKKLESYQTQIYTNYITKNYQINIHNSERCYTSSLC